MSSDLIGDKRNTQTNGDSGWTVREVAAQPLGLSFFSSQHLSPCWLLSHPFPISSSLGYHHYFFLSRGKLAKFFLWFPLKYLSPTWKHYACWARFSLTKADKQSQFSLEGELWWVKLSLPMNHAQAPCIASPALIAETTSHPSPFLPPPLLFPLLPFFSVSLLSFPSFFCAPWGQKMMRHLVAIADQSPFQFPKPDYLTAELSTQSP